MHRPDQNGPNQEADDELVRRLDRICSNPKLRRALLWLRAKEKGDEESVRMLEKSEPDLPDRFADVMFRAEYRAFRAAAEIYGRAHNQLLDSDLDALEGLGWGFGRLSS